MPARRLLNDPPPPLPARRPPTDHRVLNSAGGNVTDGLAIHDAVRHLVSRDIEVDASSFKGWRTRWIGRPPGGE